MSFAGDDACDAEQCHRDEVRREQVGRARVVVSEEGGDELVAGDDSDADGSDRDEGDDRHGAHGPAPPIIAGGEHDKRQGRGRERGRASDRRDDGERRRACDRERPVREHEVLLLQEREREERHRRERGRGADPWASDVCAAGADGHA